MTAGIRIKHGQKSKRKSATRMKKIVVLGPECTGKTTLVEELALKYRGAQAREYSRSYTEGIRSVGSDIGFRDVMPIVHGQLELEDRAVREGRELVFLDGNPLAESVYSQWYYGMLPNMLPEILLLRHYDFYLLCYPDIDWTADPARDMPTGREDIFKLFEKAVAESGVPYRIVRGQGLARLENAETALREHGILS